MARCKVCGGTYEKKMAKQVVCDVDCALIYASKQTEKQALKELKEAQRKERERDRLTRERLKPKSKWLSEVQKVINDYVRARDAHLGCITCDKPYWWSGQWHASHFKNARDYPSLRFNLWNIHKSCSICNDRLSGNIGEYVKRLPQKIGEERFAYLESAPKYKIYDTECLKRMLVIFRKKTRRTLKRQNL